MCLFYPCFINTIDYILNDELIPFEKNELIPFEKKRNLTALFLFKLNKLISFENIISSLY